ncbi:hypothetical protein H4R21_003226, partial [Coemansia helicoidea]
MDSPGRRHFAHHLSTRGSAPNLTTAAACFDALSSIDQSIRSLNSARPRPALEVETAGLLCATLSHGLHSPASATASTIVQTPSERRATKGFSHLPPSLDFIGNTGGGGGGGGAVDGVDDEEAVVAFLCSGLPHYEGSAPIHYDDLDLSLTLYTEQQQWRAGCGDPDEEEYVSDSAWGEGSYQSLCGVPAQLPSPQTPSMSHAASAGPAAYEEWIDVGALLEAAQEAANPGPGFWLRVARRTETDHMLLYHLETEPAGGPGCVAQIAKPAVPLHVFESEILSLAYVNEHTSLPVPSVLAYHFSAANPVGVPFAILDALPGTLLTELWPRLGP